MPSLVPWLLFLHVLGAIAAFGPTFSFPIIGAMGGAEPMHVNFATRVSHAISAKQVVPLALTMPITGIGLIWSAGFDPFSRGARWLAVAIVLYTVAIVFALTAGPPPGAPPAPPPAGPPAGLMDLVRKVQRGGMLLSGLVVVIAFLMVVKPDLGF